MLTYLGFLVAGMGAICIAEHLVFPKIGYIRYWNLYKGKGIKVAALAAWGLSLVFYAVMLIAKPIHQNFWFIPTFLVAFISYIILAGIMGAKDKYPEQEKEEEKYEKELQAYVDRQPLEHEQKEIPVPARIFTYISYFILIVMLVTGIFFRAGFMSAEKMKSAVLKIIYFTCSIVSFIIENCNARVKNPCNKCSYVTE